MRIEIFCISIVVLSSISILGVNAEENQPLFDEDDCDCFGLDMELTRIIPSQTGDGLECWFKKGDNTWIQPMTIKKFDSSSETQEVFDNNLIISEPNQPVSFARNKQNILDTINEGLLDYAIIEDEQSNTRLSFIWRDNWGRFYGDRIFIYKDVFISRIRGERFESESDILSSINQLEDCIKATIDSKQLGEEVIEDFILTHRVDYLGIPLPYMYITLEGNGQKYDTTTDKNGNFTFEIDNFNENEYEIVYHLKHIRDENTFYDLHYHYDTDSVQIGFKIIDDEIESFWIYFGDDVGKVSNYSSLGKFSDFKLIEFDEIQTEIVDFIMMYIYFSEAVEFYVDFLGENIEFQLPVDVYTCIKDGVKYRYLDGKSWINIDSKRFEYTSVNAPESREYHEFSHYTMHALYGGKFPESPTNLGKDVNHDGYNNPSTADSFVEGFAIFMSTIIGEHFENYWENYSKGGNAPSLCPPYGSLETNYKAWESDGYAEELAVAGVLWDLYDGQEQVLNETRAAKNLTRYEKYEDNFIGIDVNDDKILQKSESIARYVRWLFETPDYESLGFFSEEEIINLIGKVFTHPDKEDNEVIPEEDIDNFKETISFSNYDLDNDNYLKESELKNFLIDKKIVDPVSLGSLDLDSIVNRYKSAFDTDYNYLISEIELVRLMAGEDVRTDMMYIYDSDGSGNLSFKEIVAMGSDLELKLSALSDDHAEIIDLMPDSISLDELVELENYKWTDDDGVDISFNSMWEILRIYHSDFKSVYDAFINKFPDKKEEINEIFKNHGFFADISPENKKWDADETIGRAANGSTIERQERRSMQFMPGHFLKVDNDIPYYKIEMMFFDHPYVIRGVSNYYEILSRNNDGLIYLPVPSESYNTLITIEANGVETKNPYTFSSKDFHLFFNNSKEQNYFIEYSFETVGETPTISNRFYTDISETDFTESEVTNDYTLMILMAGIIIIIVALLFYFKRVKK